MNRFIISALAVAILGVAPLHAGAAQPTTQPLPPLKKKKEDPGPKTELGKQLLKVEGKLTDADPRDAKFDKSPFKTHQIKLEGGKLVRIDLTSKDVDSYLRIEDSDGKTLAEDDDTGGDWNSRIMFSPTKTGTYRLVVTCFAGNPARPATTGDYVLTVSENPAVGDAKKHEKFLVENMGVLIELRKVLEGVKDADSAKAAAPKIEKIAVRMQALQAMAKTFAPLAPADEATLKAKYEPQLKEATAKLIPAGRQAGMNCMAEPTFLEALKKLQNVK